MAGRKEYEMLFQLNARMNGGFSGTFSKAQAEFSRLGKEIQELGRLQRDVSGYQKQQAAVENTTGKLDNLKQRYALLEKQIGETTGSTAALERQKLALEQRIKDTEAALGRQTEKLEATSTRLKEAGVDTSNLAGKEAELTAKIAELRAEQDKAADSAVNFGERTSAAFDAAGQAIAAAGVVIAVKEAAEAFKTCAASAGALEESMSTVEALSGANAREMAALTAEAKELGAATKFTAKESGDAMGYMAMAGWGAADMLQGMDGVINLARASGEDLAMTADIVTDNLSAFGLVAKDTAHFSDVLAAAATSSNTSVAIMGETFKGSASVAGALKYSIEDVAVAVGLMANSGVKGSIAGTALKNTFNGLLDGATLTSVAFGEVEFSAVRADGTMKSFGNTIDELRGYFAQMTEAERVNNAIVLAPQQVHQDRLLHLPRGPVFGGRGDGKTAGMGELERKVYDLPGDPQRQQPLRVYDTGRAAEGTGGILMSGGQEMTQLVRVGTVMVTDPGKRMARVLFRDTGTPSGWLYVLASRPFLPDADIKPQRTEEAEGHRHDLRIKPWMPEVNAVVLVLFLPVNSGDGFILGEIGAEGAIKQ